jgi:hypothetical protein
MEKRYIIDMTTVQISRDEGNIYSQNSLGSCP